MKIENMQGVIRFTCETGNDVFRLGRMSKNLKDSSVQNDGQGKLTLEVTPNDLVEALSK